MGNKTGQILFLRKNHIDLDRPNPLLTITDSVATNTGEANTGFLRNRNNITGWLTTNSTDAGNTTMLIELFDYLNIDFIQLVKHNFKNYLIEWRDSGQVWNTYDIGSLNTETTNIHELDTPVNANAIRITISNTQVVDADKEMRQLIITEKKYKFDGWAVIKKPVHSQNKNIDSVMSGKVRVVPKRGVFSCTLEIKLSGNENDLFMHEDMYYQAEGLLLLLSGGLETQFRTARKGYRNEDIVLVQPIDEYTNPYEKGIYSMGIKIRVKLKETVN